MIEKVYLVLGHDDGGSEWGDYVSLYGVYVDEYEAEERMLEIIKKTIETRETFDVKSVELNQNIEEFLGGYAE